MLVKPVSIGIRAGLDLVVKRILRTRASSAVSDDEVSGFLTPSSGLRMMGSMHQMTVSKHLATVPLKVGNREPPF